MVLPPVKFLSITGNTSLQCRLGITFLLLTSALIKLCTDFLTLSNHPVLDSINAGSCVTYNLLSCTEGSERGLGSDQEAIVETRLIPYMGFNCSGILVGWTVSGRAQNGTMYPKLQIWRSINDQHLYQKIGQEIQIDAEGSACEEISQTCGQVFHCQLSRANQVSVVSETDFIGVELPHLDQQGFELYFITNTRHRNVQYVWRQEILTSNIMISSEDFNLLEDVLLSVDVLPGMWVIHLIMVYTLYKVTGKALIMATGARF